MKGKKCAKSRVECTRAHLAAWKDFGSDDATRARNQAKILAHFKEKKIVWFCAETMTKHKATIPDEYQFLLGDASGPKSMLLVDHSNELSVINCIIYLISTIDICHISLPFED